MADISKILSIGIAVLNLIDSTNRKLKKAMNKDINIIY